MASVLDNSAHCVLVDELDENVNDTFSKDAIYESFTLTDLIMPPPAEGTPAAEAIYANAAVEVSKVDKVVKRHIKRPKMKNLTRNIKKQQRKVRPHIKGKVIDGKHEQYTLTMGMMLGIRVSLSRSQHPIKAKQPLSLDEFMRVDKITFPPMGSKRPPMTPPHELAHTFKFKDYAPRVFRQIRELFDVDSAKYMISICGNYNFIEFMTNSKSGQFFFYSHDGKYMIKTQTPEENKFLRRILPHYHRYISINPNTFITRFYGMHRVKMYHLRRKLHFVIMGSVFDTSELLHSIYDLKGSKINREVSELERKKRGCVMKDQDFTKSGQYLYLGPRKDEFIAQLRKDATFLASLGIMDYSLLLGIHDKDKKFEEDTDTITQSEKAVDQPSTSGNTLENNVSIHEFKQEPKNDIKNEPMNEQDQKTDIIHDNHKHHAHLYHSRESEDYSQLESDSFINSSDYFDDDTDAGVEELSIGEYKHEDEVQTQNESINTNNNNENDKIDMNNKNVISTEISNHLLPLSIQSPFEEKKKESLSMEHKRSVQRRVREARSPSISIRPALIDHGYVPTLPFSSRRDGGIRSLNEDGTKGDYIYFLGIIDILQQYNSFKKAETFLKAFTHDTKQISCVNPAFYAKRFIQFIEEHTK